MIGVMYAGVFEEGKSKGRDDVVYLGVNAYWEPLDIELPSLGDKYSWKLIIDTDRDKSYTEKENIVIGDGKYRIGPRSVIVAVSR